MIFDKYQNPTILEYRADVLIAGVITLEDNEPSVGWTGAGKPQWTGQDKAHWTGGTKAGWTGQNQNG